MGEGIGRKDVFHARSARAGEASEAASEAPEAAEDRSPPLREAGEALYEAFRLGPTAVFVARLADGTLVDANDKFVDLTGYARDALVGSDPATVGLWPDPADHASRLERVRSDGALVDEEFTLRRKDGVIRTVCGTLQVVKVDGAPSLIASLVDVTDARASVAAERESRALLSRVFHASPAGISIHRRADGVLLDANEAWGELTGHAVDEVRGRDVWSLDLWNGDARFDTFRRRVHDEPSLHEVEIGLRHHDGRALTVLASTQHLRVRGAGAVLTVLSDITQRKLDEEELLAAKEQAEESARMKTAFLTNMTHEVRTPLTVILGFTSMLRQGVRPEYRRFVRVIERSGRRLLLMLDSILDLAQLEGGALDVAPEHVNVVSALEKAVGEVGPLAEEKGLALRVDLPGEPVYAYVDHRLLLRVLVHLLDNAIKFTEEGEVAVGVVVEGDEVQVFVRDTGVGIEQEFLPHIFDEFSQESTGLERTHQGSGLGLTVAQRIARRLGGTIEVQSEKGQGSRFVVTFPHVADV